MTTEYCAIPQGNGFKICVKLEPQYGGLRGNKALAVALLSTLNAARFVADVRDDGTTITDVRFEEPVNINEWHIIATFCLEKPDPSEIQNIWDQAQAFLTDTMDQAVASTDPFKARLLQVIRNQA